MKKENFNILFVILCLGYLIDYYDLSIFAVARMSILKDLSIPEEDIMSVSRLMFNAQALGIVVGGILCGIWGDKIGRISAVRTCIFIYSCSIIANIFITSVNLFTFFRFLAGVGLAGELAVSITLLGELGKKENRGTVSSFVYFFGILGGILATFIQSFFNWKILFLIGGAAGFLVLFLRKAMFDSHIFNQVKQNNNVTRGSLKKLFSSSQSNLKILLLTVCLIPFWFAIFFVNFAPEIAKGVGIIEKINLAFCLFLFFIGALLGALVFAWLNKILKSHKKAIFIGFILMAVSLFLLCFSDYLPNNSFAYIYLLIGMSTGYFGNYMSLLTESFGTNQRSTGSTLISNLGRSSFILVNFFVPFLINLTNNTITGTSLSIVIILFLSLICLYFVKETYGTPLEYTE